MDSQAATPHDLSTLAWVREELGKSLETAHKALRRCLKDVAAASRSDLGAIDPTTLRTARMQLHQGVGALELVGLPVGATLLRASEAAVQRYAAKPHKLEPAAVETIERASFALIDYIGRLLAGKPMSAVALFPQYQAVKELSGADRVHPADLWNVEWRWHELTTPDASPVVADAAAVNTFERGLLSLMRRSRPEAAQRLSKLCAGLGVEATSAHAATTWRLARAFFEGMSHGCIPIDIYTKRVASGLLALLRGQTRAEVDVPPRLAHDLLFFCAHAHPGHDGVMPDSLDEVRRVWGIAETESVNYLEHHLGRYDPAWVVQARKRVASAKDAWSAVAGGDLHRLGSLVEQFSLVGDSLQRLYPGGDWLAHALIQTMNTTTQAATPPAPTLAMEVATSVLYLEASLEDADFDHPEQGDRVRRLASRIDAVRDGQPPEPLEPWMEELYRRVSDRQTLGSVVQELRATLTEIEGQIDTYFRAPDDTSPLQKVPQGLQSMRGVLSVLGVDHGAQAVVHMRDDVDSLIAPRPSVEGELQMTQAERFDRLARNLGALGFLVDMLGVQPLVAKSLFVWHADEGLLRPVMGRTEPPRPLIGAAADVSEAAPRLIEQAYALAHAVETDEPLDAISTRLDQLAHEPVVAQVPALAQAVAAAQTAVEQATLAPVAPPAQPEPAIPEATSLDTGVAPTTEEAAVSVPAPLAEMATASVSAFDVPAPEAVARREVASAMAAFVASASAPLSQSGGLTVLSSAPASATAASSGFEDDDEMQGVFLEEAREVIGQADESLQAMRASGSDVEALTVVRRAFHTLKGSSRMVGLSDFGEAAWSCEQLFNARLADGKDADGDLCDFTDQVLDYFRGWVDEISARQPVSHISAPVCAAANALRLDGQWIGVTASPSRLDDLPHPESAPAEEPVAEDRPASQALPANEPSIDFNLVTGPGAAPSDTVFPATVFAASGFAAGLAAAPADEKADVDLTMHGAEGLDSGRAPLFETLLPSEALRAEEAVSAEPDLPLDIEPAGAAPVEAPDAGDAVAIDLDLEAAHAATEDEGYKIIGPLRISEPLFEIFLNEAEERSQRLCEGMQDWSPAAAHQGPPDELVVLAHSLAGSSSTVGHTELSGLARNLEHALMRTQTLGGAQEGDARLFLDAADEIRGLLHQFAAGILKGPSPEIMARLAEHEDRSAAEVEALSSIEPGDNSDRMPLIDLPVETESDLIDLAFESAPADLPAPAGMPRGSEVTEGSPSAHAALDATPLTALAPLNLSQLDESARAERGTSYEPGHEPESLGPDDIEARDVVDPDLFPIFEEEGEELLGKLDQQIGAWARRPEDPAPLAACMRTLHTFKGGARLAGAMRLGEMAHRLESELEHQQNYGGTPDTVRLQQIQAQSDALSTVFEGLRSRDAEAYAHAEQAARDAHQATPAVQDAPVPIEASIAEASAAAALAQAELRSEPQPVTPSPEGLATVAAPVIDWGRFQLPTGAHPLANAHWAAAGSTGAVRVRPQLLDRMVGTAGEVSITRARLVSDVGMVRSSLGDLGDNLERLRTQVRDMELQAETQMSTRMEAARVSAEFDPLEFDRYTRFQELSRMVAESINDVATVQRTLQRTVESTEDALASQARLTRELQDDLLRTRMVEFESLAERLYRVVRLAAKETGKQVRLDITGGQIEVDRSVLERMTGAFEHLLRNGVAHGIEDPAVRTSAGKDATGTLTIALHQEGNEVAISVRDDGAGLQFGRIRARAEAMGLIAPGQERSDDELAQLIFAPGFSTADSVSELAGRGVGMDVVRTEVNAIGGRIETHSTPQQGSRFDMVLPLTTAVTQVVMVRCGGLTVGIPANLIELVRRATPAEIEASYGSSTYLYGEQVLPFYWLGALLQSSARGLEMAVRSLPVLVIRSAQQRIALHVDEVLGNQEVVVKNLGPQLSGLPGLAGMSLLISGSIALIYNPVALAAVYGESARRFTAGDAAVPVDGLPAIATGAPRADKATPAPAAIAPLVLVVDDSLTVRRVTQRLLVREGFRVALAKDGLDALEKLSLETPAVVLSDIEMPRMDGFDLLRNIRGDARWMALPVVMITSRIAQKHRDYAEQLGANHYLGKPYSEDELLGLVRDYVQRRSAETSSADIVAVH